MGISAGILSGIFGAVTGGIESWNKRREIKSKLKLQIALVEAQASVEQAKARVEAEIQYDNEALRQMSHSWKDEYLVIVLSLPFIGSFIPHIQEYVQVGWQYAASAPEWYQWAFGGIITATFGLRGWGKVTQSKLLKESLKIKPSNKP